MRRIVVIIYTSYKCRIMLHFVPPGAYCILLTLPELYFARPVKTGTHGSGFPHLAWYTVYKEIDASMQRP